MYGGDGGFFEFRCEFILWTKVDLPAPAIPIVMITMGFFFSEGALEGPGSAMMSMVVVEGQVNFAISMRASWSFWPTRATLLSILTITALALLFDFSFLSSLVGSYGWSCTYEGTRAEDQRRCTRVTLEKQAMDRGTRDDHTT